MTWGAGVGTFLNSRMTALQDLGVLTAHSSSPNLESDPMGALIIDVDHSHHYFFVSLSLMGLYRLHSISLYFMLSSGYGKAYDKPFPQTGD